MQLSISLCCPVLMPNRHLKHACRPAANQLGTNRHLARCKHPRLVFAGGWAYTPVRIKLAQEIDPCLPDPAHFGEGRTALGELEEGATLTGTVTDIWLYHGAEIDIGAEYDGCAGRHARQCRLIAACGV